MIFTRHFPCDCPVLLQEPIVNHIQFLSILRFMFLFDRFTDRRRKSYTRGFRYECTQQRSASQWINDFCASRSWVCAVDDSYINDNFNLQGLSTKIANYHTLLKVVTGNHYSFDTRVPGLQDDAERLYALIHARFLLTVEGIKEMQPKYDMKLFGTCPRIACNGQRLLPIGLSPVPGEMRAKTFCPCCEDVYEADADIDGAFFGPYFPHLFLKTVRSEGKVGSLNSTPIAFMGVPVAAGSEMNRSNSVHGKR